MRSKKTLYIVLMIIFIGTIFVLISRSDGFSLQSIVSSSGDSYIDEKCIDVTQYYSQGYSDFGFDANNCKLVSKEYAVTSQIIRIDCDNRLGNTYCKDMLGSDAWSRDGCGKIPGNTLSWTKCSIFADDIKGGLERVTNYCNVTAGNILVAESFAGPRTITKNDLRYPITAFCRAHPSIVTDVSIGQSVTSTDIPQTLINGGSVSITSSQSLTVFYYINNLYNLPNICSSGSYEALDVSTGNTCKSTLGFTYLCSEGVWDAKTGACVVVKTEAFCPSNSRLVIDSDGVETCIYNPPLVVDCPDGYSYDLSKDSCYRVPLSVNVCNAPYTLFEPSILECEGVWELCPQCPADKVCSQSICIPQCSVGIECRFTPEISIICPNGSVNSNGKCLVDGITVSVCPIGDDWDSTNNVCVHTPDVVDTCPNGVNPINGVCYQGVDGYIDCPVNQYFSSGECYTMDELVQSSNVNKPVNNNNTFISIIILLLLIGVVLLFFKLKRR